MSALRVFLARVRMRCISVLGATAAWASGTEEDIINVGPAIWAASDKELPADVRAMSRMLIHDMLWAHPRHVREKCLRRYEALLAE